MSLRNFDDCGEVIEYQIDFNPLITWLTKMASKSFSMLHSSMAGEKVRRSETCSTI
ncbi:MAG: hypothetical protein HQM06_15495 [Magnetococcales bacterium]|nr:hypothetical protein [Magnetococcales bacterium]